MLQAFVQRSVRAVAKRSTRSRLVPPRAFSSLSGKDWKDPNGLANMNPEQAERALKRGKEIRAEHHRLKTENIPEVSHGDRPFNADEINRKRLVYRSKQRGWLEVDLLLGSWATKFVPTLSDEELVQYEALLNQETIDIFNYISAKNPPPPHLDTPVLKKIQEYCYSFPLGKADPQGFAKNKQYMSN